MNNKLQSAILVVLIFLFAVTPLIAAPAETQSQLDAINQQIKQQKQQLSATRSKERGVTSEINSIEKNIFNTEQELKSLDERINKLTEAIKIKEKEVLELEAKLEKQIQVMSDRLVFIYEQGDTTYLEVLLAATDMKDFLTNYEFMSNIINQDKDLIKEIEQQKVEVELKRKQLENQQNDLKKARASQEQKRKSLAEQKDNKQLALNRIKNEKEVQEQALRELEATSKQLEAIIVQSQAGNKASGRSPQGTGQLLWPSNTRYITSPFGMRFHPIVKKNKLHTGMDLGAPHGSDIFAADNGIVITAGWLNAYGQTVVIDHGNGVSTLYAHMSKILVSNGQNVTKGQTIGKVGSTGWSTGPHLHFEVRINGVPKNPANYL